MALSLTTAIKNKVAQRLGSLAYANTNANIQALIDGEGASALVTLEEEAQYFTMTTATGNAPDAWEFYYVDEIAQRVILNTRSGETAMIAAATKHRDISRMRAFDSYARRSMSYDPSSITEAFIQTTQNIRNYVMAHCLRLKPALIPTSETVDAAMWEVLNLVWSKAGWPFKRRPVTYYITRTEFTGATWTESTKTLTTTGVGTIPTGARAYITAGTGANQNEYTIASSTSTTVVLNQSISAAAANLTDISFFYYVVNVVGLEAGEAVDSIVTNKLYLAETSTGWSESREICWAPADEFASLRAEGSLNTGQPLRFRMLQIAPSTAWPLFYPAPDSNCQISGEVFVAMPAAPASASATTTFTKFDSAFGPPIRRAILARVYENYQRGDSSLSAAVSDEIERLFPTYAEPGNPDKRVGPTDVYGDIAEMTGGSMYLGGAL